MYGNDRKIIASVFRKVLHTECQPVRYTLQSCLITSVSHISSSQWAVQTVQLVTKIERWGLTNDCLSCVHARCGFIINTLWKKTFWTGAVRKDDEYCALCTCSSAAAAVAIGQLQLQLSHYLLVALQAFLLPEMWLLRGPRRGLEKNFSRLAIARHIFRPPHKLSYNSTTG